MIANCAQSLAQSNRPSIALYSVLRSTRLRSIKSDRWCKVLGANTPAATQILIRKFTHFKSTFNPRAQPLTASSAMPSIDAGERADPCSHSNPASARVVHTDFEIQVEFTTKTLQCWACHKVEIMQDPSPSHVALDSRDINIQSATVNGTSANITTGASSPALGTQLLIPLPPNMPAGSTCRVELQWTTSPDAVAVQWLSPENTFGKKHPFLFTQCQAIHARSLAPCQDTPGAKFTYTAAVRIVDNEDVVALMSALRAEDYEGQGVPEGVTHLPERPGRVFNFIQPTPLSSYLLAMAIGDLVSKDLTLRSRIWAEPAVIEAAAYEFADTPRFLDAAEEIAGPYVWGRYDLLLLPPSFPYGGMENVCLTFVTPTLLAGDRSLANVVAHEAAHSWTGNLVTNLNWQNFWLNEGWTVYLERRILGRLHGEKTFQFHAALGWTELKDSVKQWGADHPYTCLVPDLSAGVDPDDAFSRIPYEKGFAFLAYLERLVGKERFLQFFKSYIERFSTEPVTSTSFKAFFLQSFDGNAKEIDGIDWDAWFHGRGMPPVTNTYDTSLADEAYALATKWHCCDIMGLGSDGPEDASPSDLQGWSSEQVVAFLERLNELRAATPLHPRTAHAMKELYRGWLEEGRNSEIRNIWYRLRLRAGDESVVPEVEAFLGEQGRMKFLRPLYRALYKSDKLGDVGKELARGIYEKHKALYHPIAAKMVAVDLQMAQTH